MRLFICLLSLIPSLAAAGDLCDPKSPAMKKYQNQQDWELTKLPVAGAPQAVEGYMDDDGSLHLSSLEVIGRTESSLTLNGTKKERRAFRKACRNYQSDGDLLSAFREANAGHEYTLKVNVMPKLSGYSNDPLKEIALKAGHPEISVEYSSGAIVNGTIDAQGTKQEVLRKLQDQLQKNGQLGRFNFDLTNLDDFVCDIVQGNAQVKILQPMDSKAALVSQVEVVAPSEIKSLRKAWKRKMTHLSGSKEKLFAAGTTYARMAESGDLRTVEEDAAFSLLKKVMNSSMSQLISLSSKELQCVVDSFQDYEVEDVVHVFDLDLFVDKSILNGSF